MLFEPVFQTLNQVNARYVVVGGFATVLHGYARLTADIDLCVDLEPQEAAKAIRGLVELGLQPRAPVDPMKFADAIERRSWVEDKGMEVFSLWDPQNPMIEVDLFVTLPIPFEELWRASEPVIVGKTEIRIASIKHLIQMKRLAGRPQDLQDIEALEAIERERHAS